MFPRLKNLLKGIASILPMLLNSGLMKEVKSNQIKSLANEKMLTVEPDGLFHKISAKNGTDDYSTVYIQQTLKKGSVTKPFACFFKQVPDETHHSIVALVETRDYMFGTGYWGYDNSTLKNNADRQKNDAYFAPPGNSNSFQVFSDTRVATIDGETHKLSISGNCKPEDECFSIKCSYL